MTLSIELVTYPDRNDWVVEIWDEQELIAEVTNEGGENPFIEVFSSKNKYSRIVRAEEFLDALTEGFLAGRKRWMDSKIPE